MNVILHWSLLSYLSYLLISLLIYIHYLLISPIPLSYLLIYIHYLLISPISLSYLLNYFPYSLISPTKLSSLFPYLSYSLYLHFFTLPFLFLTTFSLYFPLAYLSCIIHYTYFLPIFSLSTRPLFLNSSYPFFTLILYSLTHTTHYLPCRTRVYSRISPTPYPLLCVLSRRRF